MLREAEMAYYPFPARKHCSDHHKAKVSGATQKVLPLVTYRNLRGIEYIEAIICMETLRIGHIAKPARSRKFGF